MATILRRKKQNPVERFSARVRDFAGHSRRRSRRSTGLAAGAFAAGAAVSYGVARFGGVFGQALRTVSGAGKKVASETEGGVRQIGDKAKSAQTAAKRKVSAK